MKLNVKKNVSENESFVNINANIHVINLKIVQMSLVPLRLKFTVNVNGDLKWEFVQNTQSNLKMINLLNAQKNV